MRCLRAASIRSIPGTSREESEALINPNGDLAGLGLGCSRRGSRFGRRHSRSCEADLDA